MRRKMERMQHEVNEFMAYVKKELARGLDDWEQRLSTAMVKSSPTDLVRQGAQGADRCDRCERCEDARADVADSKGVVGTRRS